MTGDPAPPSTRNSATRSALLFLARYGLAIALGGLAGLTFGAVIDALTDWQATRTAAFIGIGVAVGITSDRIRKRKRSSSP